MTGYRERLPRARIAMRRVDAVPIRADDSAPCERWQHGQDHERPIAPRMPSRVMHGVDVLLLSKLIGDAEERAAVRFAADYLLGVEGVREPSGAQRSGSADAHDVAIARAMAMTRYREIAAELLPEVVGWLVSFVVMDLSFVAMAARYWPSEAGRKEMKGAMALVLKYLSHEYAKLDRRRPTAR